MEKADIYADLDTWQQRPQTDSGAIFSLFSLLLLKITTNLIP